jgi:hypothetical protein
MTSGICRFASAASKPTPQSHQKATVHTTYSISAASITTPVLSEAPSRAR